MSRKLAMSEQSLQANFETLLQFLSALRHIFKYNMFSSMVRLAFISAMLFSVKCDLFQSLLYRTFAFI